MTKVTAFARQSYLNLETYRKTGASVRTPVWFVEDGDTLYVRTEATSGKVKRLRRTARVRVAPCDGQGKLKGEWAEAEGRLVEAQATAEHVNALLNRKYGFMKRLFDLLGLVRQAKMVVVAIQLQAQAAPAGAA